jgi:hypothetical protein
MPQPPPAAPQVGAAGQDSVAEDDEPAAKVEWIRSVALLPQFGQSNRRSVWETVRRRAKTASQSLHRNS